MKLLTDYRDFPTSARGGVLCIGNFDGVHLGHARMLAAGRDRANQHAGGKIPFIIMTFEPHPFAILKPEVIRAPLATPEIKRELLLAFEPDFLLTIPPTREFLSITAEEFIADTLGRIIAPRHLVEGPTFNFGRGAKGSVTTLQELGPQFHFDTLVVPTQEATLHDLSLVRISSSLIRWLIEQGRVEDAERCLGRPYGLRGVVVEGQKRGRTIGFPTANLQTSQLAPGAGVYAGRAIADGASHLAAISVGTNPTFAATGAPQITVEAYLLDFSGDLYGKTVTFEFHRWLRETLAFGGIAPLVRQIEVDVANTRQIVLREKSA